MRFCDFRFWGIALTALFAASCSDTLIDSPSVDSKSGIIGFDVYSTGAMSRAATSQRGKTLTLTGDNDTLYLASIVSDLDSRQLSRAAMTLSSPDSFSVVSYVKNNSEKKLYFNQLFTKEVAITDDDYIETYSSEKNYYWPGSDWTLDFYAIAAEGVTINDDSGSFNYSVPSDINDQQDLIYATSTNVAGNSNEAVSLSFKHACTAVGFVINDMPDGYIKSLTIKNIKDNGVFSFSTDIPGWTVSDDSKADFAISLKNRATIEDEEITNSEYCFMMLPQTFDENSDAKIEVVFVDATEGEKTLSASLAGTQWTQGKYIIYSLNIEEDTETGFENITIESSDLDCYYTSPEIKINTGTSNGGSWLVSASADDGTEIRLFEKHKSATSVDGVAAALFELGFWIDNVTAPSSHEIDDNTLDICYYVLIPENLTNSVRTVTITLSKKNSDGSYSVYSTETFKQEALNTIDGVGWDNGVNNNVVPFGFNWSRKVGYKYVAPDNDTMLQSGTSAKSESRFSGYKTGISNIIYSNCSAGFASSVYDRGDDVGTYYFMVYASLDYKTLSDNISTTNISGFENTKTLYSNAGYAVGGILETILKETFLTSDQNVKIFSLLSATDLEEHPSIKCNESENDSIFAFGQVLKKNKFTLTQATYSFPSRGRANQRSVTYYVLELADPDNMWYLPANGEFPTAISNSDTYWTSSTASDGKAYNSKGEAVDRATTYKVRAARKL